VGRYDRMGVDTNTQYKEFRVSICIRMQHHIFKTVQDNLRIHFLKTIREKMDDCVASNLRAYPGFTEKTILTGLMWCDYYIYLPLRVNKAKMIRNKGGCMGWVYKPFYKTDRLVKYMENELRRILKRHLCNIDPLEQAIHMTAIHVNRKNLCI